MKPRAKPTHLDSQADPERVKGVKDTWMVLLLFAGTTLSRIHQEENTHVGKCTYAKS